MCSESQYFSRNGHQTAYRGLLPFVRKKQARLTSSMYKIVKFEIRYERRKNNKIKYFSGKVVPNK